MMSSTREKSAAVSSRVPSRSNRTHWVSAPGWAARGAVDSGVPGDGDAAMASVGSRAGKVPQIIDVYIGLQRVSPGQRVVVQANHLTIVQVAAAAPSQQFG